MSGQARCKICNHPARSAIEQAIVSGRANGSIGEQYGMSQDSVRRHRNNHLGPAMKGALKSRDGLAGATAVRRLESLYDRTERLLVEAELGKRGALALGAIKELRNNIELLARITGELDERPQVNVTLAGSPEWVAMQQRLVVALAPFPEARVAVAALLSKDAQEDVGGRQRDVPAIEPSVPQVIQISDEEYLAEQLTEVLGVEDE